MSDRLHPETIATLRALLKLHGSTALFAAVHELEQQERSYAAAMAADHPYARSGYGYAGHDVEAKWVHRTPYGTFHVCAACHDAGHCPTDRPDQQNRQNLASLPRRCQCEHVSHFPQQEP